jgi:hypothetical protein
MGLVADAVNTLLHQRRRSRQHGDGDVHDRRIVGTQPIFPCQIIYSML